MGKGFEEEKQQRSEGFNKLDEQIELNKNLVNEHIHSQIESSKALITAQAALSAIERKRISETLTKRIEVQEVMLAKLDEGLNGKVTTINEKI